MKHILMLIFVGMIICCGGKSKKGQDGPAAPAVDSADAILSVDEKIAESPMATLSHSSRCNHEEDSLLYTTSNQPPEECLPDRYLLAEDACQSEKSIFFKLNPIVITSFEEIFIYRLPTQFGPHFHGLELANNTLRATNLWHRMTNG